MSRARMFGTLASVLACAGFVAGCGGSGYTAAESAPTSGTPTTATTPAPATPGPATALGAFAAGDPSATLESYKGYGQFPKDRAGKIFFDPTVKAEPVPTPPTTLVPPPATSVPAAPAAPSTGSSTNSLTGPAPVATQLVASLDVSGAVQTAKVGDQVPVSTPQFTVKAIGESKVTFKLNSGTLPGGGTTVEIGVGESVSLSNPSTGASFVVKVTAITTQA